MISLNRNSNEKIKTIVEVKDLVTSFVVEGRKLIAVDKVSFEIPTGKTLGVVGESGCGKSVTSLSIMGLIPTPPGKIESGTITFQGQNLLDLSEEEMQSMRGNHISMIFQEPMTALNPVFKIGSQVSEVFVQHQNATKKEAMEKSIEILKSVGIPAPEKRVNEYPHQLSGGMRQRVMIAMALACKPDLLIADEPTTALDVTIQAQILELMKDLQKDLGSSILFITHDLGVVAEMCDEVIVMYAGKVVEHAKVTDLFAKPRHPYSKGLMASRVTLAHSKKDPLIAIDGIVPSLFALPKGCPFQDRCTEVVPECRESMPELKPFGKAGERHDVACFQVTE